MWSLILSAVGNAFKIQVHVRKVRHKNRFMRKSSVVPAIMNRIWRDLIHNPLHLISAFNVLGMTSSTLASLSKGFAELSTDGQFLHLRSKQVWSRRITGVSDGILQGTEALAQGVAFGVSGVVTKPVESAREHGILGLAQGIGRAFLGVIVQPVSGALDFFSLTVDGIGASCSRCLEILSNRVSYQRIRNPRAVHARGVLNEYCEREAVGQMILHLAEATRHFGCTEIFKEPSKYAWTDFYENHFILPYQKILLITNKRVMLLQHMAPDKMDQKPCKIMWDIPWEELMALELAKGGYLEPSYLIFHLKNFKRSKRFVRLVKCNVEEGEPQAVRICSVVRKMWKAHQMDSRSLTLKVPSSQRHVQFAWNESDLGDCNNRAKPMIRPRDISSTSSVSSDRRFVKHSINFEKIWSSEQDYRSRCNLCPKQVVDDRNLCSIWRPICPDGYVSVGDIARLGVHPPNVAAVFHNACGRFATPMGYDLVWRNCLDDYIAPISIWYPRAPEGFVTIGCVAVSGFEEPERNAAYCVITRLAEETVFEEQMVWTAPDSYPWACFLYQVQSEALHFVALRQPKDESEWTPMRVRDQLSLSSKIEGST